jgi:hypothetical protein
MAEVRLYHPELDTEITVPEESAWLRLRSGWEYADKADAPASAESPAPAEATNDELEEEE